MKKKLEDIQISSFVTQQTKVQGGCPPASGNQTCTGCFSWDCVLEDPGWTCYHNWC